MPVFKNHAPGTFCYVELATSDAQAGGEFYRKIFGWGRQDEDTGEFGIYTQFTHKDEIAGAMYKITPDQEKQGVVPNWGQYIAVEDVEATTAKVQDLGGNIILKPMDVYDYGRLSVIADPTGGAFCLWQTLNKCGVGVRNEVGAMCWNELMTRDVARASQFYTDLLGWTIHNTDVAGRDYTVAYHAGQAAAGILALPEEPADTPPHWLTYFAVADCDAVSEQTTSLGGNIISAPQDLPNVGRFAVLKDPQGAAFGVVKMLEA